MTMKTISTIPALALGLAILAGSASGTSLNHAAT
jgi:hypothetical protein